MVQFIIFVLVLFFGTVLIVKAVQFVYYLCKYSYESLRDRFVHHRHRRSANRSRKITRD
jgi:hypothetical protein